MSGKPFTPLKLQAISVTALISLGRKSGFHARNFAALLGVSRRHLRRIFKIQFGTTPQAWLDEQRMVAARILLLEAEQIKVLGYDLGFKDQSTFNKHFMKHYAITPSQLKSSATFEGTALRGKL